MAVVEVQTAEQFVIQVLHAGLKKGLGIGRAADQFAHRQ